MQASAQEVEVLVVTEEDLSDLSDIIKATLEELDHVKSASVSICGGTVFVNLSGSEGVDVCKAYNVTRQNMEDGYSLSFLYTEV